MVIRQGLLVLGCMGLVVVEYMAYKHGRIWGELGFVIWVVMGCFSIGATVYVIGRQFWNDFLEGKWFGWVVIGCLIICFFGGATKFEYLNGEATQQIAEGFRGLINPGMSYARTGFLGYPMRQYYLAAWPSLFELSPLAVALGFNWILVLGLGMWYVGTRHYWCEKSGVYISSLLILLLLLNPRFLIYARSYEQSIFPISLSFTVGGWLMVARKRGWGVAGLPVMWWGSMLGTSYTPGLGSWVLLLSVLGAWSWVLVRNKSVNEALKVVVIGFVVALFGILSFNSRKDIYNPGIIKGEQMVGWGEGIDKFTYGMSGYLGLVENGVWSGVVGWWVLGIIIAGLMGKLGKKGLVFSGWILVTIYMSVTLKGYVRPDPLFALHRSLVTIPVVLFMVGEIIVKFSSIIPKSAFKLIMIFMMVVICGKGVLELDSSRPIYSANQRILVKDIVETLEGMNKRRLPVIDVEISSGNSEYSSEFDLLRYFSFKIRYKYSNEKCLHPRSCGYRLVYHDWEKCSLNWKSLVCKASGGDELVQVTNDLLRQIQ